MREHHQFEIRAFKARRGAFYLFMFLAVVWPSEGRSSEIKTNYVTTGVPPGPAADLGDPANVSIFECQTAKHKIKIEFSDPKNVGEDKEQRPAKVTIIEKISFPGQSSARVTEKKILEESCTVDVNSWAKGVSVSTSNLPHVNETLKKELKVENPGGSKYYPEVARRVKFALSFRESVFDDDLLWFAIGGKSYEPPGDPREMCSIDWASARRND